MTLSYILYFVCAKPIHVGYYDHTVISSILSTLFFFCVTCSFLRMCDYLPEHENLRENKLQWRFHIFFLFSPMRKCGSFSGRVKSDCVLICVRCCHFQKIFSRDGICIYFLSLYNLKGTDLGTHNNWFQFISKTLLRFYCILCFGKTIFPPLHLIKHMN